MKDLPDKKAAKKIIKGYKKHPDWYTRKKCVSKIFKRCRKEQMNLNKV